MSRDIYSYGWIVALDTPLPDGPGHEFRDAINEGLYDLKSPLRVSNDGGLLIVDFTLHEDLDVRGDIYHFQVAGIPVLRADGGLFFAKRSLDPELDMNKAFARIPVNFRDLLRCDETTLMPFTCIWNNVGDSPFSAMTRSEFLKLADVFRAAALEAVTEDEKHEITSLMSAVFGDRPDSDRDPCARPATAESTPPMTVEEIDKMFASIAPESVISQSSPNPIGSPED